METSSILRRGHQTLRQQDREKEKTKAGTLRGGTVGTFNSSLGLQLGKCMRIALARFLGFQADAEEQRSLMFAGGFSNEDDWEKVIRAGWDGPVLREEEIPVAWATSSGVPVTGRPDMVLCTGPVEAPVPHRGFELKSVMSLGTAVDVLARGQPKTEHVIQAAHYAWKLGLPWELWYTSRVDWPILGWALKAFAGWRGKDVVFGESVLEYRDNGPPKKILPFYRGFEIAIDNATGIVYYRSAGSQSDSDWHMTTVTVADIETYYETVAAMPVTKDLGPRPSNVTMHGEPAGWNKCDAKYCPFSDICDRHEKNYDDWVAAVEERCK